MMTVIHEETTTHAASSSDIGLGTSSPSISSSSSNNNNNNSFDEFVKFATGESAATTTTILPPPTDIEIAMMTSNPSYSSSSMKKTEVVHRQRSSILALREGHKIDFSNVLVSTKSTSSKKPSKTILDSLSSSFEPKKLTAVMGPSGSGKTSLLKVLTGRMGTSGTSGLHYSGTVFLDGKIVDPSDITIRKQIAYVEQDVSIPSTCTPREAIRFSARLRLDKHVTDVEVEELVEDILDNLGLQKVADTLIGGGPLMSGGLSGGEKKRVQCGVELVTNPSLLILDEPTSGLDSYSAQELMDLLRKIADAGATVVVTIHQPPPPVVRKIDNLLLLLGGKILYDGKMGMPVEEVFAERGYPKPEDYNIADWILQVAQTVSVKELTTVGFFNDNSMKKVQYSSSSAMMDKTTTTTSTHATTTSSIPMERVDILTQTRLLFDREVKKLFRDKLSFVIRVVSNLTFGLLFGLIFKDVGRSDYIAYPEVMASFGAQSNLLISTMFGVAQSSLMEFPKDRPVFLREYSTNHYSVVPYFLSKFVIECVTVLIQVVSQLLAAFFLMGFRTNFFAFLLLNFALAMASTSIGIFIGSCVEDPSVAAELMPALIVPQLLFSGFFIQTSLIPDFLVWAQYLCSLVYATRLANTYEFGDCDTESCRNLLMNNEVYQLEQYWYWIILLGIAAVFRIAATIILRGKAKF